jgi:hypothetical protein
VPLQDDASFVLLNVAPATGGSSRPLDVKLIGTEGAAPYFLECKLNYIRSADKVTNFEHEANSCVSTLDRS